MRRLLPAAIVSLAIIVGGVAPTAYADLMRTTPPYGNTVTVYDATPNNKWRVAAAARAWDRTAGLAVTVVDRRARADVVVKQRPRGKMPRPHYVGVAKVGPDRCVVKMNRRYRGVVAAPAFTVHEMGHCLGLGHSDRRMSVMQPVMDSAVDAGPSAMDFRLLGSIYQ